MGCGVCLYLGALLSLLLSLLDRDNLPSLQAADSRHLAAVRSCLVERFSQLGETLNYKQTNTPGNFTNSLFSVLIMSLTFI